MRLEWIGFGLRICILALVCACVFACSAAAGLLVHSDQKPVGSAPPDLRASDLMIASASGTTLRGWFISGQPRQGAILLLHGVHANRLAMLQRARLFADAGYAVLLIDFQAHGESPGEAITFGYLESRDARAAFDELQRRAPGERIGIVGVSMGGAAILLTEPPLAAVALVLEQVYPSIDEALDNRLRLYFGPFGAWFESPLRQATSRRLHLDPAQLRPIDHIRDQHEPLLIVAGDLDRHTTLAQSRALFDAAGEPKQLWIVAGAKHVDIAAYAPDEYAKRVLGFFAGTVRAPIAQATARSIPSAATSTIRSISSGVMQSGGMK